MRGGWVVFWRDFFGEWGGKGGGGFFGVFCGGGRLRLMKGGQNPLGGGAAPRINKGLWEGCGQSTLPGICTA